MQETLVQFLGQEDCWIKDKLPTPVFLGFPCGSAGKESAFNARDLDFNPWVRKIPWRRERLPTPVFWPGEFHGLYSPGDLSNPGIKPKSPTLQAILYQLSQQGKPKNTGVGSLSLLQQIFPTQELNQGLLHCRQILYQLSHKGSPRILEWVAYPFSSGFS